MENNSDQTQLEQEQLVAQWLLTTPGFFDRHPNLLANLALTNSHEGKAVSLQEKQMALLRSENRDLNQRLAQMLRFGTENDRTQTLMVTWLEELLLTQNQTEAMQKITSGLDHLFDIGKVEIILEKDLSEGLKNLLKEEPICGAMDLVKDALPAEKLIDGGSIACIPLRFDKSHLGVLLLLSPDKNKFLPSMGLNYIQQFGRLASAAIYRFRQD
jgi:uncharacterized protein